MTLIGVVRQRLRIMQSSINSPCHDSKDNNHYSIHSVCAPVCVLQMLRQEMASCQASSLAFDTRKENPQLVLCTSRACTFTFHVTCHSSFAKLHASRLVRINWSCNQSFDVLPLPCPYAASVSGTTAAFGQPFPALCFYRSHKYEQWWRGDQTANGSLKLQAVDTAGMDLLLGW